MQGKGRPGRGVSLCKSPEVGNRCLCICTPQTYGKIWWKVRQSLAGDSTEHSAKARGLYPIGHMAEGGLGATTCLCLALSLCDLGPVPSPGLPFLICKKKWSGTLYVWFVGRWHCVGGPATLTPGGGLSKSVHGEKGKLRQRETHTLPPWPPHPNPPVCSLVAGLALLSPVRPGAGRSETVARSPEVCTRLQLWLLLPLPFWGRERIYL